MKRRVFRSFVTVTSSYIINILGERFNSLSVGCYIYKEQESLSKKKKTKQIEIVCRIIKNKRDLENHQSYKV